MFVVSYVLSRLLSLLKARKITDGERIKLINNFSSNSNSRKE
jgi:hypothetical protein